MEIQDSTTSLTPTLGNDEIPIIGQKTSEPSCDHHLMNVILLSISFILLYGPYYACAAIGKYALELHEMSDLPFYAGAMVYGAFGVCNFVAPIFLQYIAARKLLFFFSFTFSFYLFSYVKPYREVIMCLAFCLGFCNSVLWASQSTYLTRNSTPLKLSRDNSLFRGMFTLSNLFGSTFLYFALSNSSKNDKSTFFMIFLIFGFIAVAGSFSMLIIWYRSRNDPRHKICLSSNAKPTKLLWIGNLWMIVSSSDFLLLIPIICQSGLSLAHFSVIYPSFLTSVYVGQNSSELLAHPKIVAEFGIVCSCSILFTGLLLVALGARVTTKENLILMILSTFIAFIGFVVPTFFYTQSSDGKFNFFPNHSNVYHRTITLLIAVLLGISEAIVSTRVCSQIHLIYSLQITTILGLYFVQNLPEAFSMSKLFMTGSTSVSLFLGSKLAFSTRAYIVAACQILGTALYGYLIWNKQLKNNQA